MALSLLLLVGGGAAAGQAPVRTYAYSRRVFRKGGNYFRSFPSRACMYLKLVERAVCDERARNGAGVPVLLLAEIPFMMAKFAVFDAFSKLAYNVFPQANESVAASLAISLISGMVGELRPLRGVAPCVWGRCRWGLRSPRFCWWPSIVRRSTTHTPVTLQCCSALRRTYMHT